MSIAQNITCDACGQELNYSHGIDSWRLELKQAKLPPHPDLDATCDVLVYPPLPQAKHFCGIKCAGNYVILDDERAYRLFEYDAKLIVHMAKTLADNNIPLPHRCEHLIVILNHYIKTLNDSKTTGETC